MFLRMIRGTLFRQWKKMLMIAFTIALGASLATAMLGVMMDVGDKVNQELKTYGANIVVAPREASVISDLYEVEDEEPSGSYLLEEELGNIKTIFWTYAIVDFTPFIRTSALLDNGETVTATGSWFNHHMELPTGETVDTGITNLRTWWEIKDGAWLDEQTPDGEKGAMVGAAVAERAGLKVGDTFHLVGNKGEESLKVVGIFDAGGEEDDQIFMTVDNAQALSDLDGYIDSIEVSALTTPDNELAEKAAKNPKGLSLKEYEAWYCTAYVSSVCYQIQQVITGSVASAVRQVAESEGAILDKTQLLMILITILSLIGAALGICNLVTASVMERSSEIGLMKAIGAHNSSITGLVLTEIIITAIVGGAAGMLAGYGFAQIIGHTVFASSISIRPMLLPVVAVLVFVVTMIGSVPAIRMLLKLRPTEVLHGR